MFGKKIVKVNRSRGADGIRECDRVVLRDFQATCERIGEYDALKAALKAARDVNFVVNPVNLQRFVGNAQWFSIGGTQD